MFRKFRTFRIILILVFIPALIYCGIIPQPPKDTTISVANQQYLKILADKINTLKVVTANPDGNRKGNLGDMVLFNNSGTYYLEICVSSPNGTVWKGAVLSAIP